MVNEEKLDEVLLELGFPEFSLGTKYLREAVKAYTPGEKIMAVYRQIGRQHNSTGTASERDIRHAIGKAWARCPKAAAFRYFGNSVSTEKGPTNSEMIARLERICHQD